MGLSLHITHVKGGELKQAGPEPRTDARLLQALPAISDDSDNKSASDLSDSELCAVASASQANASGAEIPHPSSVSERR